MAADVSSPPMRWDMLKQRPETEGQDLKVTTPGSLHWRWCSTVSFHMLCWKHHEHRRAHTTGAGYEPQLLKWEEKKTKKRRWIPVELRRTSSGNKVLLFWYNHRKKNWRQRAVSTGPLHKASTAALITIIIGKRGTSSPTYLPSHPPTHLCLELQSQCHRQISAWKQCTSDWKRRARCILI